jgi:perosamine synthetase
MTNIQAAIGLAQTENLEKHIQKKRLIGKYYNEAFKDIKSIQIPLVSTKYAENIYWVYGIVLKDEVPYNADHAMQLLKENKIGTRPFFYPIHKQPVMKSRGFSNKEEYPISSRLAERGFYIPSGLGITNKQIDIVIKTVMHIFNI